MKERFANLLTVKSIMTLALTLVFCVLALCGTISGGEFLSIFTMIVGFYFGTQATKKAQTEYKVKTDVVESVQIEDVAQKVTKAIDAATYEQHHPSSVG